MIIADTGFFFALANQGDRYHLAALSALEAVDESLQSKCQASQSYCWRSQSNVGAMH